MPKMNVNLYVIEDYENETVFRPKKTNPKQTQFPKGQNERKIACRKIWPHRWTKRGRCFLAIYIESYILIHESLL